MELDRWAYINRMRWVHPGEKIMFALGLLVICLSSPSYRICLTVFVVGFGGGSLAGSGYSALGLLAGIGSAASILLPSVAAVMLSIPPPQPAVWSVRLGRLVVGIGPADLRQAILLASRALGAVSSMLFLVLTTPMVDLLQQLRRWHLPPLFMDLMELVYRFIFVTLETGQRIIAAQHLRLGL